MQQIPFLYIARSPAGGRGVYTAAPISIGSVIEISPVIVLDEKDRDHLDQTDLYNYYFMWGEEDEACAIALGYASLYNHSYSPNARYLADYEEETLHFYALFDIEAGKEITVNYNGEPDIQDPLWFRATEE